MCDRCKGSKNGMASVLDVRSALGFQDSDSVWMRTLWPDSPDESFRYLVESTGRVLAIQEPGCPHWHIRTANDDQDVNDNFPPVADDFDNYLEDEGSAFQFDTADPVRL